MAARVGKWRTCDRWSNCTGILLPLIQRYQDWSSRVNSALAALTQYYLTSPVVTGNSNFKCPISLQPRIAVAFIILEPLPHKCVFDQAVRRSRFTCSSLRQLFPSSFCSPSPSAITPAFESQYVVCGACLSPWLSSYRHRSGSSFPAPPMALTLAIILHSGSSLQFFAFCEPHTPLKLARPLSASTIDYTTNLVRRSRFAGTLRQTPFRYYARLQIANLTPVLSRPYQDIIGDIGGATRPRRCIAHFGNPQKMRAILNRYGSYSPNKLRYADETAIRDKLLAMYFQKLNLRIHRNFVG